MNFNMKSALAVILLVIISVPAVGMGSAPKKPEYKLEILKVEVVPSTYTPSATSEKAASPKMVQEISITAKRFEFLPNIIEVKQGIPVRLILTSKDTTHGFLLSAFNIDRNIKPGKKNIVEFTPDKSGEFDFSCSVFCGYGHGTMRGKLMVTP